MLLSLEEVKRYLRIDYDDDDSDLQELIEAAEDCLIDSIDNYLIKINNDRFKRKARLCAKAIIQECHDNRTLCSSENEKVKFIINSFLLQMQYCSYEVS